MKSVKRKEKNPMLVFEHCLWFNLYQNDFVANVMKILTRWSMNPNPLEGGVFFERKVSIFTQLWNKIIFKEDSIDSTHLLLLGPKGTQTVFFYYINTSKYESASSRI